MSTQRAPSDSQPTYVVELTPPGRAAVAIVLVAGPQALGAVSANFTALSGTAIAETPLERIVVGRWANPHGEELVVSRRADDEIEIHCHGGSAAVRFVVESLVRVGCLERSWREWLCSGGARLSRTGDAITAAAHVALTEAVTSRVAAIILDQLNGALTATIHRLIATVAAAEWDHAARHIASVLRHRELGLRLTTPWRVVLAGRPNVGKSCLINALAGYERAIVSPTPGTTRDVVALATAIDGWPVVLSDTAGLRRTRDELESAGVELAKAAVATADLAILVEDATNADASNSCDSIELPPRVLRVRNKSDLIQQGGDRDSKIGNSDRVCTPLILTSALTGAGIGELAVAISSSLVPNPPDRGAAVAFTRDQVESLILARDAIERRDGPAAIAVLQSLLARGSKNDESLKHDGIP